ncbi:MAG: ribose 5-phosphate isomerase B [Clostridia bacterium]|nr:ribose 5-phosphate isomerase B [Clostridia bacterium]
MKIALGFDHGGIVAKKAIIALLESKHIEYTDFGTFEEKSCDYPDYAVKVAKSVAKGEHDLGILVCGTGIGMSIAANKVKGIRASCANDLYSAEMTRRHNNSNVLALGARVISVEKIVEIVDKYISTDFDGGYHQRRLDKIKELEESFNQ